METAEIAKKRVNQIIHWFGDGRLLDGSACSNEFRAFLAEVESERLSKFVEHCLAEAFENSGLVLQDLINELGRRLDFVVENGAYKGKVGAIGFDGIWRQGGHDFIVEVKTTDAYNIKLDRIAEYRSELERHGRVGSTSSVLIVVGRQDTGSIEAQVRGSRYAWDMRIIGADSLVKLVSLKEETEEDTSEKITEILKPIEYTRVDKIVDLAFSAAREVVDSDEPEIEVAGEQKSSDRYTQEHTPRKVIDEVRDRALTALTNKTTFRLIRKSKALYWSADSQHAVRAAATVSKRHKGRFFWYAYHPEWDQFLGGGKEGYFVLAGVGLQKAFALPHSWIAARLGRLNKTETERKTYHHIHLEEQEDGSMLFKFAAGETTSIDVFSLKLND